MRATEKVPAPCRSIKSNGRLPVPSSNSLHLSPAAKSARRPPIVLSDLQMSPHDTDSSEVSRLQRWMQAVVTHPRGVDEGIASESARAQIDVMPESVESVVTRSRALSSRERLGVYANAYYARLLECLREEFPTLVHALGEENFDGFGFAYLQNHPSQSYTLSDLGRDFPQHLVETRPEPAETGPDWADFLIDLAILERTFSEVFDGPGVENAPTLGSEQLLAIPPDRWPHCRLVPVPCLRLLTLRFPVHEYVSSVRRRESVEIPPPEPTRLVVTRREFVIRRFAVSAAEHDLLAALVGGATVLEAVEKVAVDPEFDPDDLAGALREWFRGWAAAALFQSVEVGG